MSSWRFGDVQHSLSLSCDFILRLPLWGLSALRAAFSLRSLAGAIMEQVRLNQGAAGMRAAQRDARSSALMNLASLVTDTSQTLIFSLFFHPAHALLCQLNDLTEPEVEQEASYSLNLRFVPPTVCQPSESRAQARRGGGSDHSREGPPSRFMKIRQWNENWQDFNSFKSLTFKANLRVC